jgi:TolC family type I secretion outer membrane protein
MKVSAARTLAVGVLTLGLGLRADVAPAEPLSLEACVEMALRVNQDAAQAENGLVSARADVTSARAAFLPNVSVSGTVSKPEEEIEVFQGGQLRFFGETWSADASARMTVFDFGGTIFNYQSASRARTAAEQRFSSTRQGVVYDAESRYYEVARQQELADVAVKASELSAEQLKKTRAMKDLGAATQADVYKAEVDHSNARLEEIRASRDLRVARASLATFVGIAPDRNIEIEPLAPQVAIDFDLATAKDRALATNPRLEAARLDVESRSKNVSSVKTDRLPSVSVFAQNSYFNFEPRDFDDEHNEWRIGASVNLTLFDGFVTKANIRRAESNRVTAERALGDTERDVLFQVEQTYLDLDVAKEAIAVAEDGVRSSEEDLRLAQERFKIGEGTILDVIDAQVNLRRARSTLVAARYDARLAESALMNAIGAVDLPEPEME